jgi:hypothetical protein
MTPEEAIQELSSWHVQHQHGGSPVFCAECDWDWPCPVKVLIDAYQKLKEDAYCDHCEK